MEETLDAADIFDWSYLVEIGVQLDLSEIRSFPDAIRMFAYSFTSAAKTEHQNQMLADWLRRATHLQSPETAEEVLAALAVHTKADLELLRRFARQNGVRLKRS